MKANGGLLSRDDLESYRTTRTEPLRGSYRGHEIATNHPPGGGILLVEMLNILECFDLAGLGHNTTGYIRGVSEAMKAATADQDARVGDPAFFEIPSHLTSRHHAEGIEVIRSPHTFGIGAVHGIRIEGDRLDGGADPGHDGVAIGV